MTFFACLALLALLALWAQVLLGIRHDKRLEQAQRATEDDRRHAREQLDQMVGAQGSLVGSIQEDAQRTRDLKRKALEHFERCERGQVCHHCGRANGTHEEGCPDFWKGGET